MHEDITNLIKSEKRKLFMRLHYGVILTYISTLIVVSIIGFCILLKINNIQKQSISVLKEMVEIQNAKLLSLQKEAVSKDFAKWDIDNNGQIVFTWNEYPTNIIHEKVLAILPEPATIRPINQEYVYTHEDDRMARKIGLQIESVLCQDVDIIINNFSNKNQIDLNELSNTLKKQLINRFEGFRTYNTNP